MLYRKITQCRICGNPNLVSVLDLGGMALTGVFPKQGEAVESGPLTMVKCMPRDHEEVCGLVQLLHNYDLRRLYGDNYGYRSGLNKSMVEHLRGIVREIENRIELKPGDVAIDIASNDGTLLQAYKKEGLELWGIDPTAEKFKQFYPPFIPYISDFFSADIVRNKIKKKAKVVTSIAMFYDLEDPIEFMRQIESILADDGMWIFEQSYMPTMIDNVSYDTICHEHLEYYAVLQIKWMVDRVGLKIIDIQTNNANGGSFRVTVAKNTASYAEATDAIKTLLRSEEQRGYNTLAVYELFEKKTHDHRDEMVDFVKRLRDQGKKVFAYGASTKGNVILQFCQFTPDDIQYIAEVNEYKFGRLAPGTNIPIISDVEAKSMNPDYFIVLPWHFRENIIGREKTYLENGGHLFFPLPRFEII